MKTLLKNLDQKFTLWHRQHPWQYWGFITALALCWLAAYMAHRQPVLLPIAGIFITLSILFFASARRTFLITLLLVALHTHAQPLSDLSAPSIPSEPPHQERGWPLLIGCLIIATGGIYVGAELYCMWEDHRPPEPPLPMPTNNVPKPTNEAAVVEFPLASLPSLWSLPPSADTLCSCAGPIIDTQIGWAPPDGRALELTVLPGGQPALKLVSRIHPRRTDLHPAPTWPLHPVAVILEISHDLAQWEPVQTNSIWPGARKWIIDRESDQPAKFYRVRAFLGSPQPTH